MKPKTIVLMVVAVVCGLAASYMTSRVIAERNNDAGDEEKVVVLVAKQKITYGTLIKDPQKYFIEKSFTKGEEPKKALRTWDQLKDKRINKPLSEDQFVTAEDLQDPKGQGPESLLPPGMRAIAIRVNVASGAAGFILPNSRVDVICTTHASENSATLTILQNMLVLASDQNYTRMEDKSANVATTVTLAAKPEDAMKLRLAEAAGELSLTLRGAEDNDIIALKPARPNDLAKPSTTDGGSTDSEGNNGANVSKVPDAPPGAPGAIPPVKADPPPPKTVTQIIYNGESVTKTVYVVKEGEVSTSVEKTDMSPKPRPEKKDDAAKTDKPDLAPKKESDSAPKKESESAPKKAPEPAVKPEGTK
jgi:pilus assembly protein CpaB